MFAKNFDAASMDKDTQLVKGSATLMPQSGFLSDYQPFGSASRPGGNGRNEPLGSSS
jgi:hypothetical protein